MKRQEQDRLLDAILGGEDTSEFRQASLDRGLAGLRRVRRQRQFGRVAGLAGGFAVLIFGALTLSNWRHPTVSPGESAQPGMTMTAQPARPEESGIRSITDEELFALFPGRSLALIGPPGRQQLVFLDQPTGTRLAPNL